MGWVTHNKTKRTFHISIPHLDKAVELLRQIRPFYSCIHFVKILKILIKWGFRTHFFHKCTIFNQNQQVLLYQTNIDNLLTAYICYNYLPYFYLTNLYIYPYSLKAHLQRTFFLTDVNEIPVLFKFA